MAAQRSSSSSGPELARQERDRIRHERLDESAFTKQRFGTMIVRCRALVVAASAKRKRVHAANADAGFTLPRHVSATHENILPGPPRILNYPARKNGRTRPYFLSSILNLTSPPLRTGPFPPPAAARSAQRLLLIRPIEPPLDGPDGDLGP